VLNLNLASSRLEIAGSALPPTVASAAPGFSAALDSSDYIPSKIRPCPALLIAVQLRSQTFRSVEPDHKHRKCVIFLLKKKYQRELFLFLDCPRQHLRLAWTGWQCQHKLLTKVKHKAAAEVSTDFKSEFLECKHICHTSMYSITFTTLLKSNTWN